MALESPERQLVVAILGATGTGKSELALSLAARVGGSIISADSMQVYRGMDIGTAKVPREQRRAIEHYLIDVVGPTEDFSVAAYQVLARKAVEAVLGRQKLPIVVGGTGLYARALLDGFEFIPHAPDHDLRADLRSENEEELRRRLRLCDPAAESGIAMHDVKRLIRSLEIASQSDELPSEVRRRRSEVPWRVLRIGLLAERADLYARLDARVDAMVASGMENEVRRLLAAGVTREHASMQGIGYKEVSAWVCGEIDRDTALLLWKRRTRSYTKRQETWFKRDLDVHWIHVSGNNSGTVLDEAVTLVNDARSEKERPS
jgi:tRNA dimethylallyltransferase